MAFASSGPDPRKASLGKLALVAMLERLEAQSLRLLTKHMGWEVDAVKDLCQKVKAEVIRPDAKVAVTCTFVLARKLLMTM